MKSKMTTARALDAAGTAGRVARLDWGSIAADLDGHGCAVISSLITTGQCVELAACYDTPGIFRSRVVMARHGFGRGEYQYFSYPLPPVIAGLRTVLYSRLVEVANRWNEAMGIEVRYPKEHKAFLERCHEAEQTRPTPLLLQYGPDDYNCLHQDLYGEHVFPLQVAILLSEPGRDFIGGEFVMTELSTNGQRANVVSLGQGDAVVFTVNQRPAMGRRGIRKVAMRHGVSRLRSGKRHTVGIIFHDAK